VKELPPATSTVSRGAIGASIALGVLALFFWLLAVATLSNLGSSDAAGNALAEVYGAAEIILLWLLLAILMLIATVNGAIPRTAVIAALVLLPASGIVALMTLPLLADPRGAPFLWPIVILALVPPLVVCFCYWALLPVLRAVISPAIAAAVVWGGTLLLCLALVPMRHARDVVRHQEAAASAKYAADFERLPADAPLWDWTPFLATRSDVSQQAVLERIRHLDRRQSDAGIMLERGDFPLRYLGRIDLDPTSTICEKARGLLVRQVEPLVPKARNSQPYTVVADAVADAVAGMEWLVGYGCSCDAQSLAWESMAKAYREPSFDVVRLAQLRDPKELGRILREDPAVFSMLTPQSHLKAWLKFAGDKAFRERALAGARALPHRTADAVEMLNANEYVAQTVMAYLPELDLEPTRTLCAAALKEQFRELMPVYRPRPDDPRPYRELIRRLGGDDPFAALLWLAQHGCDADVELNQAESLVRSYQDSPQRAATLTALAEARR
jgi:hypothetical protein